MPLDMQPDRRIPYSIGRSATGIEWTDFSGNPWQICTRLPAVSGAMSGCEICYAATYVERRGFEWGPGVPRKELPGFHARMRRLDRLAVSTGMPFSVFSLSLGDWLDAEVDPAWRSKMIETVEACPNLTWLLLTHRPHLAGKFLPASWRQAPPANVWAGVTVDHPLHAFRWRQHAEFWGHTARAWVSAEPLAASLADIDLSGAACVIVGGASNTKDPAWAFDTRWVEELLAKYGQAVFFKQRGVFKDGVYIGNKKKTGRELHGRILDHTPWPRHRAQLAAAANPQPGLVPA